MSSNEVWSELLAGSKPKQHIVQLYLCRDEEFFGRAIALFAASGLKKNEGVILVATPAHWKGLRPLLEAHGIDVPEMQARGQLTVLDAAATLPRFLVDGMPDPEAFKEIAGQVIGKVRAAGFQNVRWWGEMVNLLWEAGNPKGFHRLEELFDEVAREQSISIFCSVVMDPFDVEAHELGLPEALKTHSHLIPVEHYARLEQSVDRALIEVLGEEQGQAMRILMKNSQLPHAHVPAPQSAILLLKRLVALHAREILTRARRYYYAPVEVRPIPPPSTA